MSFLPPRLLYALAIHVVCLVFAFSDEFRQLRLIPGEFLVERIDNVEDTKGNNGDSGRIKAASIKN